MSSPRATESARLELSAHPEIEEAIRTRQPVTISSSGGHNGQSASTAIPVLRHDAVPAVLLLRGRDAQPALSPAQLEMASSLAQVAAQALDGGLASPLSERAETIQGGGLDRRLQEEFERARRYSLSFSLVLLDVQPATGRNGDAPPESGERLRREVGARLRRELRLPDFLARYGGDEFAIVLPETDLEGAVQSVTRVQERLAILPLEGGAARSSAPASSPILTPPSPRPTISLRWSRRRSCVASCSRADGSGGRTERGYALPLSKPFGRIQRDLILPPDLEVQMGSVVGVLPSDGSDRLVFGDGGTELDRGLLQMGIHGVVAVAVLEHDGQSISTELPDQTDLSCLHRLHRSAHRRRDPDAVPSDDSAARQRVTAEPVDNGSIDGPIELANVGGGD